MGSVLTKIVFAPPELATYSANQGKDGKGPIKWLDTPRGVSIPMIYLSVESPYTIIFSHGNAEDIGGCLHHFQEIGKRLNVSFVVYDYEGYGLAEGTPNEQACYDAIDAVYSHLVNELGRDPRKLFLWGRSLGSGPSSYLAARLSKEGCPPQGLILQSPPASIFRVAFDTRFTLPGDLFPNIDRMPQIACKTTVIHGTRDEIVPFSNGESLFFALQTKYRALPLWIPDGGHNDLEHFTGQYHIETFVTGFLERVTQGDYVSPTRLAEEKAKSKTRWSLFGTRRGSK